MRTAAYRGVSGLMCTYVLKLSLFMFLATFLSYSILFYLKNNLTFTQKGCVCQKRWLFSPTRSISVILKRAFLLKIIFANQSQPKCFSFSSNRILCIVSILVGYLNLKKRIFCLFILFNELFNVNIYIVCLILLLLLLSLNVIAFAIS